MTNVASLIKMSKELCEEKLSARKVLSAYLEKINQDALFAFSASVSGRNVVASTPWNEDYVLLEANNEKLETVFKKAKEIMSSFNDEIEELAKSEDFWSIEDIGYFYWFVAIESRLYQVDSKLQSEMTEKMHSLLMTLIGEGERDLSDEGRYVPGSAKERAAIRSLSDKALSEEVEDIFLRFSRLFSSSISQAKKLYSENDDGDISIIWPEGVVALGKIADSGRNYMSTIKQNIQRDMIDSEKMTRDSLLSAWQILNRLLSEFEKLSQFKASEDLEGDPVAIYKNTVAKDLLDLAPAFKSQLLSIVSDCEAAKATSTRNAGHFANKMSFILSELISGERAKDASGFISDWNRENQKKRALKIAKEMGDFETIKMLTSQPQYAEFLRKGGRDVKDFETVEKFLEHFGLDAQQFGKSLSESDRKELMQRSASAFQDMADVLGVEDSRMGIRGTLSLALASRGKGGKGAPIAHYERDERIINLTKRLGTDGSLSHEFGHALDARKSGVSFFDSIEDIDDNEILDSFRKLNKAMFFGDLTEFVEARKEEEIYLRVEKQKALSVYESAIAKANENLTGIRKQREIMIDDLSKALKRHENASEADTPLIQDEIDEIRETMSELEITRKRNYDVELWKVEPYRLYVNELTENINEISKVMKSLEKKQSVNRMADVSKLISCMPIDFLAKQAEESGVQTFVPSEMLWDAAKLGKYDSGAKKSYYASPKEMFARSFETHIAQSLNAEQRQNTFLCHEECLKEGRISAYPKGSQRQKITDAMEEFIAILKKKGHM